MMSPLGYDPELQVVNTGDTAELYAYLYDENAQPIGTQTSQGIQIVGHELVDTSMTLPGGQETSVTFKIQKPDGTIVTQQGTLLQDGAGYLAFNDTSQAGEYLAVATFTLTSGVIKSTSDSFSVTNPFIPTAPASERQAVQQKVWRKLEDCFDSDDGGPWLREMTNNVFNPSKIDDFIDEALFDINVYNPQTNLTVDYFTLSNDPLNAPNINLPILVEGTFVAVIRHLMRSYTEQANPTGGSITWEDRRDYLQRWGTIYQIEFQFYDHLVKLWKRQFFGFGQTANLISSKAGRLMPGYLRSRNIGRGYWTLGPIPIMLLYFLVHHLPK